MAIKNIQIKGSFDASQILATFKQIRNEAAKSNVSDKLLGGYDKELEKVEKLITLITAAQSRGLTDNLSIKEFSRLVGQLEKLFGILNVKAQGFTDVANYKTESANLRKYTNLLEALIKKQDGLRKAAEDYIDANKKSLGINEKEAKLLKKAMADAEAYKKVVDDLVISKAKAAQQLATTESVKTDVGKKIVDNATGGNFEFGIAAKKGRDKSRENLAAKGLIDELKALAAALKEYQETLRKTMEEGGTAEDAIKSFIEVMQKYKLEVKNADEVLQQFQLDMDKIVDTAMNTTKKNGGLDVGIKSNVTKGYNLSLAAANLVNAQPILEYNNGLKERIVLEGQIETENNTLHNLNLLAAKDLEKLGEDAKKTSQGLVSGLNALIGEALKYVNILELIKNGFESIGRGAKQILSVTTAWRSLRNVVKSTFNDVKALDKSFASIAMVTEYSVKDMWELYDQYAEMANRLGQSTQSVVEASGLYYQQGLKTNEVLKLTEETMKLATLAGLDFKEATSQMTAALRAFHMDMSEGAHVTDVYAEVAAHAAVDVQGLSEAMSATAAIANSAGMSFENTTAMLATMVEATQEAPKNLGTAMKTILARFTELKTNVAGTADSEFDDLDYNKVDKALKSVGVNIKDATGLFRDMDDVLLELSSKWKGLDRNSLRYIATIAAGSRQQSRFIALMENYERTMELVDVALNSAGRSSLQFAKYLDTVEYRVNKIKNSWEQFRTSLLDSDIYKGALDKFGGFLDKLNDTSAGGLLTLGATWLTVGRSAIGNAIDNWSDLGSSLINKHLNKRDFVENQTELWIEQHRGQDGYTIQHIDTGEIIDDEDALMKDASTAVEEAWEEEESKAAVKGKAIGNIIVTGLTSAITTGLTIDNPISAGLAASASSAMSLLPTFIQLGKTFGAGTGTAIGVAVTAGIGLISTVISGIRKMKLEAKEATTEFLVKAVKKEIEDLEKDIENKKNDVKNTLNEIKNLQEIKDTYETLSGKVYKTAEEQEKYNLLVEDIKSNYPELIETYDEETNLLKLLNDLLDDKILKNKILQETLLKALATTELYLIDKLKLLNYLNFLLKLKDLGYLSDRNNITVTEDGSYYTRKYNKDTNLSYLVRLYNEKEIYNLAQSVDFNADKIQNKLQELVDQGLITLLELKTITGVVKLYASDEKNLFNSYLSTSKEYIENSGTYSNLSSEQKTVASYLMAGKMNDYSVEDLVSEEESLKILDEIAQGLLKDLKVTDYTDLSADFISLLNKYNISLEQYEAATANKYSAIENLRALLAEGKRIEKSELSELDLNNIDEVLKLVSKMNFSNYEEILKEVEKYQSDGFNKYINTYTEKYVTYKKLLEELGIKSIDNFLVLTEEEVKVQSLILDNLEKTFGKTDNIGKAYENLISSIKKTNLPTKILNELLSFDPSNLKGQTKEDAKNTLRQLFTDAINSGLVTKEAADKTIDSYLSEIEKSGIGNFAITNIIGIDTFIEKASKKYKDTVTNYKSAIDTINSNISNGFINYLDKDKIEEAIKSLDLDPSKYFFTDSKGNYLINVEALNQDVLNQLTDEESITKELEDLIEEGVLLLILKKTLIQAIIDEYKASSNRLEQEKAITKEYALQRAYLKEDLNSDRTWADIASEFDKKWDKSHTAIFSQDDIKEMEKLLGEIDTLIQNLRAKAKDPETILKLKKERIAAANAIKEVYKTNKDEVEEFKKSNDKAYKDWLDKTRAVADAQKSLSKAIENVAEKQKELKELIEGTNYKSSIDGMYNYTTAMDYWVKETERAKKKLEKAGSIAEAKNNYLLYVKGLLELKSLLTALNKIYQTAYDNFGNVLKNNLDNYMESLGYNKTDYNIEDFITLDKTTGLYQIKTNATNRPGKINEYIRKWIEDNGPKVNEYLTNIKENNDKIEQLDEEFLEYLKKARDEYIDLQDLMIDILREKYLKEIDDLQNKYDAMNEADNKYLESLLKNLDRQRKLRDLEKNWNDLTNKERKLSLMLRDTSGSNLADVKNLLNEIEDLRTLLLDDAVDEIIEKLSEFYELQKESRDAEIQYKQTLIDDVNLLKEATEALEKILTSDDLVNWWKENVTGIEAFSEQKLGKLTEDWDKLFSAKSNYVASIDDKMEQSVKDANGHLKDVSDLAEKIVKTTSEGITNLAEQSLQEAGEEYKKAVKTAKDALLDAVDAVAKLKEALLAAIDAANESKKAFDDIHAKYLEFLEKLKGMVTVITVGNNSYTELSAANRKSVELAQTGHGLEAILKTQKVSKDSAEYRTAVSNSETPKNVTISANYPQTPAATLSDPWNKTSDKTLTFKKSDTLSTSRVYNQAQFLHEKKALKLDDVDDISVEVPKEVDHGVILYDDKDKKWRYINEYDSVSKAEEWIAKLKPKSINSAADAEKFNKWQKYRAFAEGGLVNYTGPAWVDGSRSKPEAFLSSEDTRRIGEAARILADLPILSQPIKEQVPTTTIGDTTIQIDVHVDSIANDYDLDEAMNKVEQRIVNAAKYAGSNVILKKH